MKRIRIIAIIIAALMAVVSLYFQSMQITLSVIAGSAIVIASFELLYFIISRAFGKPRKSAAFIVITALLKFVLLGFILWYVVIRVPVHTLAFLVGLSTIVAAIIVDEACNLLKRTAA